MALTFTKRRATRMNDAKVWIGDVTFDSSYPTGGEAFAPADIDPYIGANAVFDFVSITQNDATVADHRLVTYDQTNSKLIVLVTLASGANVEAANASNQSAVVVRVLVVYGGTVR